VTNDRWDEVVANARFEAAPNLLVEILSPGTQNRNCDFVSKRRLYATYGVEEYLIVDADKREVILFQLQDEELVGISILKSREVLTSRAVHGFGITVDAFFADLS
jgi:Uma2 family endonuclease